MCCARQVTTLTFTFLGSHNVLCNFYTQLQCFSPLPTCPWFLWHSVYEREWWPPFRYLAGTSAYLSILTCLTLWQFIGRRHKIHFGSWEARNNVAKLKSKHHKPAFHIYGGNKNKDFWNHDGWKAVKDLGERRSNGWLAVDFNSDGGKLLKVSWTRASLHGFQKVDVLPNLSLIPVWWFRKPVLEEDLVSNPLAVWLWASSCPSLIVRVLRCGLG